MLVGGARHRNPGDLVRRLIALIAMVTWYVATRDWRAGAVLVGYAAGWLPWFYFAIAGNRTMFLFYAMPLVPFMVLAIVLALGLLIGGTDTSHRRRSAESWEPGRSPCSRWPTSGGSIR